MEDLELVGLKLVQDMRLLSEKVRFEQEKVEELTKSLAATTNQVANLKAELADAKEDIDTTKAQLHLRTEATHHLERDNSSLRDSVAKLKVQLDSSTVDRQQLMEKCQVAESEKSVWQTKYQQLEKTSSESVALKTQCYYQQNHIKSMLHQTTTQLELLEKDHSKLERSVQEVRSFNKIAVKTSQVQSTLLDRAVEVNSDLEKNLVELSAKLTRVQRERDELYEASKNTANACRQDDSFIAEWEKYQETMKTRIAGFIEENQKLVQERDLARNLHSNLIHPDPSSTADAK